MKIVCSLFTVTMILTTVCPAVCPAETLTLQADEWCPYNCEPGSDKPGFMVEIARAVFEPLGHSINYAVTNWSRAIMMARKGRIHGIIGATKSEVPQFIFPGIENGFAGGAFFVREGYGWRYSGLDSLADVRLAVIQDYGYGVIDPYIETHQSTDRVIVNAGENALELNIKLLLKGRADAVLATGPVLRNTASEMGVMDRIEYAGGDGETGENNLVYIAFSPENPRSKAYADQLTQGMKDLRSSGRLAEILARYGLEDWEGR